MKTDYIYTYMPDNKHPVGYNICNRCKTEEEIPLPMSVKEFLKWSKAFIEKHKNCKEENP